MEKEICVYCEKDVTVLPRYILKDEPPIPVGKFKKDGELVMYHKGDTFCINCAEKCFGIEVVEG